MYVAPTSRPPPELVEAFLATQPFGVIVGLLQGDSAAPPWLQAAHVPLLWRGGARRVLEGHVARANPLWRGLCDGAPVLCIFQGPHAYVSPTWYPGEPQAPTWNYVAVHVRGRARQITDAMALESQLRRMMEQMEGEQGRRYDALPRDYVERLLGQLVAFEIEVDELHAGFKLSGNKDDATFRAVLDGLHARGALEDHAVAAWMRRARPLLDAGD